MVDSHLQRSVKLVAVEYCVPESILNNDDLEKNFDSWNAEKIYKNTGVRNRHIADKDVCTSDLGVQAAKSLFERNSIDPKEIEMLIFCTQTPDYILPSTACIIQDRLGLPNTCASFDINLGCSGYVYGLAIANSFITSNMVNNVLLIVGDTSSKPLNLADKSVRMLFGDAATATYLNTQCGIAEIVGEFVLGTDGSGFQNIIIPAGGFRIPKTQETIIEKEDEEGNIRSLENTYMNGKEVFMFTLKRVPETINALLAKTHTTLEEVDWFVFHQANKFILDFIAKKMKISPAKVLISLEEYGNTSSASIPITLKVAQDKGLFKNGDLIMFVGFGVGYSWGANLIRWTGEL
jgi:3-oxoacyl-[acyl-carrier-protein] synthase III